MNERTKTRVLLSLFASAVLISAQRSTAVPNAPQDFVAAGVTGTIGTRLAPTMHPVVPETLSSMWFAPEHAGRAAAPLADFARGVRMLEQSGDAASALPFLSAAALADTDVAVYARYYRGIALHRLNRLDDAEALFASVAAQKLEGFLPEAALFRQAEVREARHDYTGAESLYEQLVERQLGAPQQAWLKLGMMAEMNGHRDRAREAFRYVIETFPLTQEANESELGLDRIDGFDLTTAAGVANEVERADALFNARRVSPARSAYERLRGHVSGSDRDLVTIRLAALDAQSGKARAARDVLRRYVGHAQHAEHAQFALLGVSRDLDKDDYPSAVRAFVAKYPASARSEEALNDLARFYVLADEDGKAADVYRAMVERFPAGAFAERAAWKAGWWAYRHDNYSEVIRIFEQGAATFPRSDYRPSWLYWSGRAYDGLGEEQAATDRFRLAATDYLNTYYGRLAWKQLEARSEASVTPGVRRAIVPPPPAPPTIDRVARLIQLELFAPALAELQHAQRIYGDSAPLQATIALVQNRIGNLRLGINAMKRAYPQYMTAGGETLPAEILQVLFPLDYWPLLQYHARANNLDPYLVAALVGQESTFDAGIVSSAKAIGLMQIMPATGRQYAKKLGIKPFSTSRLTEPEVNVRIGTRYFSELIQRFGGAHFALASYNAGESRIDRWQDERGPIPQDEFIDDIPFPETQNYVKRILGTAEDYRRLYGTGLQPSAVTRLAPSRSAATALNASAKKPAKKSTAKKSSAPKSTAKKSTAKKPAAKKASATKARKGR